jgi:ADP-dependent NAD(P)H-hydrate dehydratase / NAD(P)H-hydrate epimerase
VRPLVTPEEMASFDRAAIEAGTPVEVLMDRAGRAVARAVIQAAGGRYGKRVAIVCGKGNNGGDGFVAARVLHEVGLRVDCLTVFDPAEARGAARHHLELLRSTGCSMRPFSPEVIRRADVIVDAIFGTGFRGAPEGEPARAIGELAHLRWGEDVVKDESTGETIMAPPVWPPPRIVAVDVPSGIGGNGEVVEADVTVAMGAEKLSTALGDPEVVGRVEVADIGIPVEGVSVAMIENEDAALSLPHREPEAHKRSVGSVAIVAGSSAITGAAALTARGAIRGGTGYATLGSTHEAVAVARELCPELLTVEVEGDVVGPDALDDLAEVVGRAGALAVGPGLGVGKRQTAFVERVLAEVELPVILDADGLNVLEGRIDAMVERHRPLVITPHPAELARLLDASTKEVQADRLASAMEAARRFGCAVVLKGYRTIVAEPDWSGDVQPDGSLRMHIEDGPGFASVNPTGGPELATAGTGDVLTGLMAAFCAYSGDVREPVRAAVYVHGLAGSVAAGRVGPGVVAWDVAEAIPEAVGEVTAALAFRG